MMFRAEVEQKWQAALANYQRSQLSIAEYCREHSITPASFYRWRKKTSTDQRGRFLPVVIEVKSAPVRLCFANDAMIEVYDDSNPVALQLAVTVLS
jgi:transposase-like protein|tara:strand:+ start:146 stop:433 length:288 start_codon:yes stop_codon:yes gene_type:complete